MSKCKNKVVYGEIVDKPDFEINKYPVYYIYIDDAEQFDTINQILDGLLNDNGHCILSAETLREQYKTITEDEEADYEMFEDTRQAMNTLKEVMAVLDDDNFEGDVWFYTR